MSKTRPPLPPFSRDDAAAKVRAAEDGWNGRDPDKVVLAYTADSRWRNRDLFFSGRPAIVSFLRDKWQREREYRLVKQLWAFHEDRIAVRFVYEFQDPGGAWFRAHGNEQWAFDGHGLMRRREASINDVPISESQRLFRWPLGPRPPEHPGLAELDL